MAQSLPALIILGLIIICVIDLHLHRLKYVEPCKSQVLMLTGYQVRALVHLAFEETSFIADVEDLERDYCIGEMMETQTVDGKVCPAGIYVWRADAPELGSYLLNPQPD